MKPLKYSVSILAIAVFCSCGKSDKEVVEAYIEAYNKNDYTKMETLITDSYHISYQNKFRETTKPELEATMDWNHVMKGRTKIVKLEEKGDGKIETIESYTNEKNRILNCKNPQFRWMYYLESGKIRKVVYDTLPGHTEITNKRAQVFEAFHNWCENNDFDPGEFYGDATAAKRLLRALKLYQDEILILSFFSQTKNTATDLF